MLEAHDLTKRYDTTLALDRVSFSIRPSEILGYLGPNGSGKSTTINIVTGLLEQTSGTVSLGGYDLGNAPEDYKRRIGYVPEEPHLYTHLTAPEYLTLVGSLRGFTRQQLRTKVEPLLQLFDLWGSRYQAMSGFSKGMRQRVLLSAALLHNPTLLVLDEPFSGLDVNAAILFRTLLRLFAHAGGMILFSSHRLDIVQQLCSRVVILQNGRVVAQGTPDSLQGAAAHRSLEDVFAHVTGHNNSDNVARDILQVARA